MADSSRRGVTFNELLCLMLIGLKISHNLDWSWWTINGVIAAVVLISAAMDIVVEVVRDRIQRK
jgi:hypothetical protein